MSVMNDDKDLTGDRTGDDADVEWDVCLSIFYDV
jgi:hypothetical protein